ncbi:MAG: amino acid racemase [Clostridia bacterium]|nr:amino acid racemase [Clostridia bacterium]
MKTIGLIGGMTYHTTLVYYEKINKKVQERLGGFHSAKCLMYSFDFDEVKKLQDQKKWDLLSKEIIFQGKTLQDAGADYLVLCSNTIHKVSKPLTDYLRIPLIHIIDAVGESLVEKRVLKVLLLGTRYTVLDSFYQEGLKKYGIEVVIPTLSYVNKIHDLIFKELSENIINDESKMMVIGLIESYGLQGVTGVILGCTELSLLINDEDVSLNVFDSLNIHIEKIVETII